MTHSAVEPCFRVTRQIAWPGFLLGLFLVVHGPIAATEPPGLDRFVERVMKEYSTPGVSLAVVKDDKVLVLRGYGVRRFGTKEAVDEHTLFKIASCTKSFTAAVLAKLVDEKKLSWDDPVIEHLPEFVLDDWYATRMVTCRDLLAHRSGLPGGVELLEGFGYDRQEILRRIRYVKPSCSLRERANYSNLGILVAGITAARVGGMSWEELVRQRLLLPLGMKRSGTSFKDRDRYDNVAEAHVAGPNGTPRVVPWIPYDNHGILCPAGGMTSTASDLANWVRMLLNEGKLDGKPILSAGSVREMFKPAMVADLTMAELPPINDQAGFAFTMGWGSYHYQGYQVIEKGGALQGMRSVVVLVPQKKFGVVVLANMDFTVVPEAVRAYLLDQYVAPSREDVQRKIHEADRALKKMFTPPPPVAGPKGRPSLPLEKYAGIYENRLYGKMVIRLVDGKLRWEGGPARLGGACGHLNYDTFLLEFPEGANLSPSEVTFTIEPRGVPQSLHCDALGTMNYRGP